MAEEIKRKKIVLGGYEMWVDVERSILFEKETSMYGVVFDVMGTGDGRWINSYNNLTKEESAELLNYIKKFTRTVTN